MRAFFRRAQWAESIPWLRCGLGLFAVLAACIPLPAQGTDQQDSWQILARGGTAILIRHGETHPGVGDPPGFKLGDCGTQRNLSDAGRNDARRLGKIIRENKIPIGEVLSSRWCRCRDTARLAFGRYQAWDALNNIFDFPWNELDQTPAVRQRIADIKPGAPNVVMISHGVNIAAVAGVSPSTAEMIIVKPDGDGGVTPVGRIAPRPTR